MSRDSSYTYVHMHSSHHADLFEEFVSPQNSTNTNSSFAMPINLAMTQRPAFPTITAAGTTDHIPPEDILIPAHLMPVNPEDEDDVVPDQHAAFGITRALANRENRGQGWRDFDTLAGLVRGVGLGERSSRVAGATSGTTSVSADSNSVNMFTR